MNLDSQRPILLGSASPRRLELLRSLGFETLVRTADVDERALPGERPLDYVERIVSAKRQAIRNQMSPELSGKVSALLVADTVVVLGDLILGKPTGREDARSMLSKLSGGTHRVMTRFCVDSLDAASSGDLSGASVYEETVVTEVVFRSLSPRELEVYLDEGEWTDKAGAYAIQGRAAAFCPAIHGSYSNVVGLPLCEVAMALRRLVPSGESPAP